MNILRKPNDLVLAVLKPQLILNNVKYRLMNFNLIVDIDGGKLIHNELTRSIIFMTNEEFYHILDKDNIINWEFLYRWYFLVPEDFNELEITDKVRSHFTKDVDDLYLERVQSYNILTTTKCNARCFYCYELNSKHKTHMTEETARKVVRYIKEHSSIYQPVSLSWFGGEPLFNMKVIDTITNGLRDAGFKFSSFFTSNGYLLDNDVLIKGINSWGLKGLQITIDGTESVYNKAKNYIYKGVNAYLKVLNNIANALNHNVDISVRLNCDNYNIDDLKVLVQELHNRFGNHPHLRIYTYPIFENENYTRSEEDRNKMWTNLKTLEEEIVRLGYPFGESPSSMIMYYQCMADGGGKISISPNGDLGTCEHFIDSDFFGHVDTKDKDFSILRGWKEYEKPLENCKTCPRYPSCLRPSKCEEMRKCDNYYLEWYLRKQKFGLIQWYHNFKSQLNRQNSVLQPQQLIPVIPVVEDQPKKENVLKRIINKWM